MIKEDFIDDKFTIDELLKKSWKHKGSEEFVRFFKFISQFSHYSRFNHMLMYIQNPAIMAFGGESYWRKKFDRTIKPDARKYIIIATGGPGMIVYDFMETVGDKTPEQLLDEGLGGNPFRVERLLKHGELQRVLDEAERYGIVIRFEPLSYFKGGHITTKLSKKLEIVLKKGATDEENFRVLIHELAHLFLGHTKHESIEKGGKKINLPIRELETETEELEAETISFLICKKLGLDTRAAEYLAGYISSEDDLINFGYELVIKTADKIENLFVKNTKVEHNDIFRGTTMYL